MNRFKDNYYNIIVCVIAVIVCLISIFIVLYQHKSHNCCHICNNEQFDANMTEFLPLGEQQYDLRGFPSYNRPLYDCWNDNYKNCYNSNF